MEPRILGQGLERGHDLGQDMMSQRAAFHCDIPSRNIVGPGSRECTNNLEDAMDKPATGMGEDELDALCSGWPGVARSIKWEVDLVYSVANKMFAVMCTIGPERGRLSFKVDAERFLELGDQPGMAPAHYMARAFWISVTEPERFDRDELAGYVRRSYELVRGNLSKKVQATLADAPP
jgi:predicted DNA-binding protein (MmcQ/YjbR family)